MTTINSFPDLIRAIEQRFLAIGQSTTAELSVTGQPYAELVVDVDSIDEALDAGLALFEQYATRRPGTLYWRERPVIERSRVGRRHTYRIRMKLLISDNPVVERLANEARSEVEHKIMTA